MMRDSNPQEHEWLRDVAWRVHRLVRESAVVERFHEMILRWCLSQGLNVSDVHIWERRLREHEDRIRLDARLRDKEAGPPGSGWDWRYLLSWLYESTEAGVVDEKLEAEGWVPPDLLWERRPELQTPLPLSDRPSTLEEKYAILAAIHDHFCRGVEKIRPWPRPEPESEDWFEIMIQAMPYAVLVHHHIAALIMEDRPAIEVFLVDVRDDLAREGLGSFGQHPKREQPAKTGDDGDGPVLPNRFRWRGELLELPPRQWALLDYLWERESATFDDLIEHVWNRDEISDASLRAAVSRLNNWLSQSGIPLQLATKQLTVICDRSS